MEKCPKCETSIEQDALFCPECGENLKPKSGKNVVDEAAMVTLGGMETLDDTVVPRRDGSKIQTLEEGSLFAERYLIKDIIGRGGMGVVYKAEDQLASKDVALKLIRPERLAGSNAVQKLIAEGITARDIRHPNVIAVYDVGESSGQPFVSMEYLDGRSLRSWHREKLQKREDVPMRIAARIICEILDGLKAAHAAGVIHRDLKPENIMLIGEPTEKSAPLKILDFGIARATGISTDSGTGTGLGTPRYMAPEQITSPDAAGEAADLYSLSVLFYELLVDVLPQGHWQPPSGGRSEISHGIDKLIETGLSNRPANRPQSAMEYREALIKAVNFGNYAGNKKGKPVKDGSSKNPPVLQWIGGITAAIIVLAIVGYFLPDDYKDPCEGLSGQAYEKCAFGDIVKSDIVDEPAKPTGKTRADINAETQAKLAKMKREAEAAEAARVEQERLAEIARLQRLERERLAKFAKLNGQWDDGLGTVYSIRMNSNGSFTGTGYSVDGLALNLSGTLTNTTGSYTVSAPQAGLSFNGRLEWDRGCHISFQTFGPGNQSILEQGQMHVNHAPGAPCPS